MADAETTISAAHFFSAPPVSVATVPHLIAPLDAAFLNAVVRINGAKPGIWNVSPPYDENDQYVPFRDEFVFKDWALGYNQNELLKAEAFEAGTIIVDSDLDSSILQAVDKLREQEHIVEYYDIADVPALLKLTGWALIPVRDARVTEEVPAERGLFVAAENKADYVRLLQKWCHDNGRTYLSIAAKNNEYVLIPRPAPDLNRKQAAWQHGHQFLHKMAVQGISPADTKKYLDELIAQISEA